MSNLSDLLQRLIISTGSITFAQFMDTALYAPGLGYYEQPGRIGRKGDFFTSPAAGSLFGELLAFQLAEWLANDCPEGKVQLVEAGVNDGALPADILNWLSRHRPELLSRLEYCIVESSSARREWQAAKLHSWTSNLKWVTDIRDFAKSQINGIIFSNEFLDALPVHRLAWDAEKSRWREWRVTVNKSGFAWILGEPDNALDGRLPAVPPELSQVLPHGFIAEISPPAFDWWRAAAAALGRGRLMTIDYGYSAERGLRPDCPQGALRAYYRHHAAADLLGNPGEQDLTADVNFSALEEAGLAAGLGPATLLRQEKFLTQIAAKIHASPNSFAVWDSKMVRQFQTLAHPEHLGHPFQVFIQY
jgi:SAM-dependent MidA family methyltransferase